MVLVAVLTLLSVAAYVREWVRHMNSAAAKPMSTRPRPAPRRDAATIGGTEFRRQIAFWLAALVALVLLLWLLSDILLPFVAGMAIAYLLDPLVDRLERFGVNRLVAALSIIVLAVLIFVVLDSAGGADPRRPVVVLHRQHPGLRHQTADADHRSEPAVGAEAGRRRTSTRKRGSAIW